MEEEKAEIRGKKLESNRKVPWKSFQIELEKRSVKMLSFCQGDKSQVSSGQFLLKSMTKMIKSEREIRFPGLDFEL